MANVQLRQLRSTCWEAQDSLDKHGSNMRLALGIEQFKFAYFQQVMIYSQGLFNSVASHDSSSGTKKEDMPDKDNERFS